MQETAGIIQSNYFVIGTDIDKLDYSFLYKNASEAKEDLLGGESVFHVQVIGKLEKE